MVRENGKQDKKEKTKYKIIIVIITMFLLGISSFFLLKGTKEKSFKTIQALFFQYEFQQLSSHNIYIHNGYASAVEYPIREESLHRAVERFRFIFDENIKGKDMNVYYSVIPDKNYFLAEDAGQLVMDYEEFYSLLQEEIDFMQYIDIKGLLSIEDYYKTDTHWKQEKLEKIAGQLANGMGVDLSLDYERKKLEKLFWGIHCRKTPLPMPPEVIYYLDHDVLNQCKVYDFQNEKDILIYDMAKAQGEDPYEMFLSGAISLITIENPNATTDKELIIFRDSFASSLAPLLAEGYAKMTLVDIRYLRSDMLSQFVTFENQDVLFIYSTLVLNHSETLK